MAASSSEATTNTQPQPAAAVGQQPQFQPAVLEARAKAEEYLKERKHNYYRPLYHAANGGDWKAAKSFIDRYPNSLTARITKDSLTILMVAARARQWKFVQEFINFLPSEALAMQTTTGFTALHFVVMGGSLDTAKALITKNPNLTQIQDNNGHCPLILSLHGNGKCKDLVWYLILVTKNEPPCFPFTGPSSSVLIISLLFMGFYDICLYLVHKYPQLVVQKVNNFPILSYLSIRNTDFWSGTKLTFWQRLVYKSIHVEKRYTPPDSVLLEVKDYVGVREEFSNVIDSIHRRSSLTRVLSWFQRFLWESVPPVKSVKEVKLKHLHVNELVDYLCSEISERMSLEQIIQFLHGPEYPVLGVATVYGVVEIVKAFLLYFPDLVFGERSKSFNILRGAVQVRQPKIFKLVVEMSTIASYLAFSKDESDNTILHLAAKLPPPGQITNQFLSVSGAAFRLQRELQWFKEVEKASVNFHQIIPNKEGLTSGELFTKEHKEIIDKGEKWMKDTANSCMIVTTLIATVVLAAAFTVPGGNNDKGTPNFLDRTSFLVFVVSDALALFSSATSLLMFLSILTARYEEKDFLRALPKRLILGLGSLFLAIVSMMVAFGATLSLILSGKWQWISIPIILLGSIPVTVFAMLQLPLFVQMIDSTYGSGVLGT